jgi:general secretion pathway protein K
VRRARGVALIIALVVVALATVLATRIGARGALDQRRSATILIQEQAFEVGLGAEAWAMEILKAQSDQNAHRDSLEQAWAQPLPPLPIEGGTIEGGLEDMQGRFNVNSLVNANGTKNEYMFGVFQRLLARLELEPKWASLLVDWIDVDQIADGVDGAEDGYYTGLAPPYRPPNRPISSTSELLALPGFGIERYRRLAPYIAALPIPTTINTCTASGELLDALAPGLNAFGQDAKQLAANRQKGCFPTDSDVRSAAAPLLSAAELASLKNSLGITSSYFRGTIVVSIGTAELTLYSLFYRDPGGYSHVILRSFGSE